MGELVDMQRLYIVNGCALLLRDRKYVKLLD